MTEHELRVAGHIQSIAADASFHDFTQQWLMKAVQHNYAQNFSWLGRPIVQIPQDIYALQEIIWQVKPDLIIETGVAHGGSLIMSASMLALLDYCEAVAQGTTLDPKKTARKVVGIDIDIRAHNRKAIEAHPLTHFIHLIEGSSIADDVVAQVQQMATQFRRVLICLDSNHTHDHVLAELKAYAHLVTPGSYCIVWDTGVEDFPAGFCADRPWDKGNNPKTAAHEFLRHHQQKSGCQFEVDKTIEHKITITASPDGFLKRVA